MKKVTSMVLLFLAVLTLSCRENAPTSLEVSNQEVQKQNDFLRFKDRQIFERYSKNLSNIPKGMTLDKFLLNMEEKYDFKSLRAANGSVGLGPTARVASKPNSCIEDDYLASMFRGCLSFCFTNSPRHDSYHCPVDKSF